MGEKKRRLAAAQPAAYDARLLERAFAALRSGQRETARGLLDALEPRLPRDAHALHMAGVLALQLGENARAEPLLARAVELDGRLPALRSHLAIACRRLGRSERAVAELQAALRLDPGLAEVHANLGTVLLDCADYAGALASYERALAIRGDLADAVNGRGNARLALGDTQGACADFERALALDPRFHEAHYNLSRARSASSGLLALESALAACELAPDNDAYWTQLEAVARNVDLEHPVPPRVHETLFRALGHPAVDPTRLVRPLTSLALTRPAAQALRQVLLEADRFAPEGWRAAVPHVQDVLGLPLLARLLEEVIVPHAFLQRLIAAVRAGLLAEWSRAAATEPSLRLAVVAAIAQQGFNTEYVNGEGEEERDALAALREAIGRVAIAPLHWYALYACYRPLHTLDGPEAIATALATTALGRLAQRQIAEPLEERRIAAAIVATTPVVDEVSVAVRDQYEANPYPRWSRVRRQGAPQSIAAFLRRLFPEADLAGVVAAPARLLVAGCGTGRHSVESALRFWTARVLAVDLSLASLAYAVRKTRELSIANVEYRQADLLALGALDERFDVVECSGVLHHLRDPLAGWRTLCGLVDPGGVMRIGLYSETARRHVVRARELIASAGFPPTPDGIRACRQAIVALQGEDALLARVVRGGDFYSLSGCRDLLFHVQETRFTVPRIADALAQLGLAFVGFEFPDDNTRAAFRARFPDPQALARLDCWDRFEAERPDTFAQMYQFWVRRPA